MLSTPYLSRTHGCFQCVGVQHQTGLCPESWNLLDISLTSRLLVNKAEQMPFSPRNIPQYHVLSWKFGTIVVFFFSFFFLFFFFSLKEISPCTQEIHYKCRVVNFGTNRSAYGETDLRFWHILGQPICPLLEQVTDQKTAVRGGEFDGTGPGSIQPAMGDMACVLDSYRIFLTLLDPTITHCFSSFVLSILILSSNL